VKIAATKGTQNAAGWQYTVKRKFKFRVVNNDNSEMPSDCQLIDADGASNRYTFDRFGEGLPICAIHVLRRFAKGLNMAFGHILFVRFALPGTTLNMALGHMSSAYYSFLSLRWR
jgi:hypothetical protein